MSDARYRLERGVRLRRETGGDAMLLVPEGIVALNDTAAAALELADGSRTVDAIATALCERFDAPVAALQADVRDLMDALVARGFVTQ